MRSPFIFSNPAPRSPQGRRIHHRGHTRSLRRPSPPPMRHPPICPPGALLSRCRRCGADRAGYEGPRRRLRLDRRRDKHRRALVFEPLRVRIDLGESSAPCRSLMRMAVPTVMDLPVLVAYRFGVQHRTVGVLRRRELRHRRVCRSPGCLPNDVQSRSRRASSRFAFLVWLVDSPRRHGRAS